MSSHSKKRDLKNQAKHNHKVMSSSAGMQNFSRSSDLKQRESSRKSGHKSSGHSRPNSKSKSEKRPKTSSQIRDETFESGEHSDQPKNEKSNAFDNNEDFLCFDDI